MAGVTADADFLGTRADVLTIAEGASGAAAFPPERSITDSKGGVMLQTTAVRVPEELLRKMRAYAVEHHTTLSALFIDRCEQITQSRAEDPLVRFSRGEISKEEACAALDLRDYAQLLIALGAADLPLPLLPEPQLEAQAEAFSQLWAAL